MMRRLRLSEAKGPVVMTQLVRGRAGFGPVCVAPRECFKPWPSPAAHNRAQRKSPEKSPEKAYRLLRRQGGFLLDGEVPV